MVEEMKKIPTCISTMKDEVLAGVTQILEQRAVSAQQVTPAALREILEQALAPLRNSQQPAAPPAGSVLAPRRRSYVLPEQFYMPHLAQ